MRQARYTIVMMLGAPEAVDSALGLLWSSLRYDNRAHRMP
jgi:hypothetical protein